MDASSFRRVNLQRLRARGFVVAASLPTLREELGGLRPAREIGLRLMALDAVFTWVADHGEGATSAKLRAYASRNDLARWMTTAEKRIFRTTRAKARAHAFSIGWKLENMWPLAWALGLLRAPLVDGKTIPRATHSAITHEVLPKLGETVDAMLARAKPRSVAAVARLEDLFYCAHNAARSAQLGSRRALPKGLDPIVAGGVIHERRHALTWCLSPGVRWDDVDLST